MTITIGLVANVYNEANALPGWLEAHTPFFDDIRVLHAGPGGSYSNDGTLEILSKWRIPVEYCAIDEGFGMVRSRALAMSPCNYVMLLDADERFYHLHRMMQCSGQPTPHSEVDAILSKYTTTPDWDELGKLGAGLKTEIWDCYDQGARLRDILEKQTPDALLTIRRHWHDLSFKRPTQNWHTDPDWQMRIVRNHPSIKYDARTRMHERLVGAGKVTHGDQVWGPFFDHYHFAFKRMEQEQRSHDVAVYNAIDKGQRPPTWEEFRSGV